MVFHSYVKSFLPRIELSHVNVPDNSLSRVTFSSPLFHLCDFPPKKCISTWIRFSFTNDSCPFTWDSTPPPPPRMNFKIDFHEFEHPMTDGFPCDRLPHPVRIRRVLEWISLPRRSAACQTEARVSPRGHTVRRLSTQTTQKPCGDLFIVSTNLSVLASSARLRVTRGRKLRTEQFAERFWSFVPSSTWYGLGAMRTSVRQMPVSPQCGYSCVWITPVSRAACRVLHFICTAASCQSATGLNTALNCPAVTLNSWPFASLHAIILYRKVPSTWTFYTCGFETL